ncbi:conserved hypothetical protein [Hyella patelloides LEGE 07179]|uniref:BPP domain-containing protein n=1 Tax=Hyella patelloides LEGE 07179 TaxID=945734 RepID=A0A563VP05_9CYAN|nr:phytase [Hyella patelloides]VEP13134.1 conserved hypothetical protein [Hyella patelloides LEGE 07179]
MTNNVRFAMFNASLNRSAEEELIADLSTPENSQAQAVAEIIQRNNPDVLLLNEFDYDSAGEAVALFQENYLAVSQNGTEAVEYPYVYLAPSNTGIPSGLDLDNDGATDGAGDAYGFGFHPGQFGMVLLSKYPIDTENVRTFQNFLWQDMPGALLPDDATTAEPNDYYSAEELEVFRLSSKSHWDIPVEIDGEIVHILASHPTPPVFDGEEDRNGRRNHDEIRLWADYITPGEGDYIYDDEGNYGGLATGARFVIAGDQNADPFDGDSTDNAILQLLDNSVVARSFAEETSAGSLVNTSVTPSSKGGIDASDRTGNINDTHIGNPAFDTGDFNDAGAGNLRVDYVLPSQNLDITDAGVFWTTADDELFRLIGDFDPELLPIGYPSSDHRLVYVDTNVITEDSDNNRQTVTDLDFLGEVTFDTGSTFADTEVGGISGLTYDAANEVYYALSDDRSNINDARFYTVGIDLSDGSLDEGDLEFQDVTTLLNSGGRAFASSSLDPEGIALINRGTLFISSEGDADNLVDPFIGEFSLGGQIFDELALPDKFLPTADRSSGIQNNQAFESLTITPDQKYLFTATENPLYQDGEVSSLESGSPVRILQYDLETGETVGEFLYETEAIPVPPEPEDDFADNGLVELLAIDNTGTLLALERSFAAGVGNNIRLYEINLQGATNISSVDGLLNEEGELTDVDETVDKRLLLDFSDLGITLDNSEAVSFGATLPDGRQSLIVTSDNNFNDAQKTQFLAFAIDTETTPTVTPVAETPPEIRFGDPDNPDPNIAPDADDPAIYVHPENPEESFVITTFKNGGLRVYDLAGEELQSITPENIRYNNVDIAYGVEYTNMLGETSNVDLAIASDRANDTLAIYAINPNVGANGHSPLPGNEILTDVTAFDIPESIFGVDDGEATAYGLATYTSVVDGKNYVFVSQADGNKVAQLEITAGLGAADGLEVSAEVVRIIDVPVPVGEEAEDFQVEGMVVDRETGDLYVGQEEFGIWKYSAEPNDNREPILVDTVTEDTELSQVPFSNLVVFGDSLSDTGNVSNATEGLIPPSPPYGSGRFSNGDLIVDAIAESLELPENESFRLGGNNYAFGAAETGEGTSEFGFLLPEPIDVPNIGQQIDLYLSDRTPTETDLFYVYGGTNDFVSPLLRGETLPTPESIVGNITTHITELAEAGAQTFVIPNLPSLGDLPLFLEQPEATAILNDVTEEFNQLLDTELDAIASELDVEVIEPDVYSIATEIQNNPADFGLSNTTDAFFNQTDPISDTTDLSLTGNPEEFFFWDIFHPTATATEIIAQEVIDVLPSGVNQFEGETPPLVPDVEGLTIYYGEDGNGYLLASSQGDNTFAIYDRAGSNSYLGNFAIEGVEESDGADITNVPLGDDYSAGLLVVQDGSNTPEVVFPDPEDGEIQNFNTNFKYVSLADFADIFPNLPPYDPNAFDPRNPETRTLINGVASGDTTQDSTVLWTRSTVLGNVTFEYATDAEFNNIVGTVDAEVTDTTLPVKVEIGDLEAGTDYYYRVTDGAGDTETGEFTTSAELGTYNGFRFGATGDWQQAPPYPSLANADERNLELFIKLGDTIFADAETPALPGISQARELSDFRTKHGEILTSRVGLNTVPEIYSSTSILATIDDHEIVNNFAGGAAPGDSPDAPDIGSSDEPLFTDDVEFVNDTAVYESSLQAYQEYHPLQDRFYGETGDFRTANERQLYRYNTYGSDAAVIMLDSRSFRDDQLDPVNPSDPNDTTRFFGEAFDPNRTLLGRQQVADLKADLLEADANGITWKFITIPEPIQNFGLLGAEDRFEGYAAERNEILQFIDENDIDNVVFMAGDFHGTIVNNLTYQTTPGGEQIATNAFEIVTGPAAFNDGLFGSTVADLSLSAGLITEEQKAFYDSLPIASDSDSEINDRDDFIKNLLQEQSTVFGYDPVGLNNNLDIAEGAIDAELLQGDYVSTHTFGWTEFDINAETQQLKVTTYGVDAYSEEELLTNPDAIINLTPTVVSEFVVNPQ